jgi:hypothetical protein
MSMRSKILVALLLAVACLATAAHAAPFNVATVRGTVITNEPDCITCSFGVPHGCYLSMQTGGEPFNVALPGGVDEEDCNALEEGDCIEVTGEVSNVYLVSGFSMSSIQLLGSMWSDAGTSACE